MNQTCDFELLMSVMQQSGFDLARQSCVDSDLLIINQCDYIKEEICQAGEYQWRMLSNTERGLSKSRNLALKNARGTICQLCDDDEFLVKNHKAIVLDAYRQLPDADVIVFNVNRINYQMKKKYYQISAIQPSACYRAYQSGMITFRLKPLLDAGIRFDERFGSGCKFGGGEDSLLIRDMRNAGLRIYEHPAVIATIDYGRFGSQWFHGYTRKYFYNLGVFAQCNNPRAYLKNFLWALYDCWKLRREKDLTPWQKIYWRYAGMYGYKHGQQSYEEFTKGKNNG